MEAGITGGHIVGIGAGGIQVEQVIVHAGAHQQRVESIDQRPEFERRIMSIGQAGAVAPPSFERYRAVVEREAFPADLRWNAASIWVGPDCHLVHYPLRGWELYNLVATVIAMAVIESPGMPNTSAGIHAPARAEPTAPALTTAKASRGASAGARPCGASTKSVLR